MTVITEAQVDRITAQRDRVLRNLEITQAYHDLSLALAAGDHANANWCTFATWASKQAGQTIRQEDLTRSIEAHLGASSAFQEVVGALSRRLARFTRRRLEHSDVARLLAPSAKLDRSSAAVAKGNLKVFAEIGREFARYLAGPGRDDQESSERIEAFARGLREDDPTPGQSHLRTAFRAFYRSRFEADPKRQAEAVLLANLSIGYHEQVRLQPEIFAALNASVADVAEVRRRVLGALFQGRGRFASWAGRLYFEVTAPVDRLWVRLTNQLRRAGRIVVTEALMTLRLPTGELRLGRDLDREPAEELLTLEDPELRSLASQLDSSFAHGSTGATDWTRFEERMCYIAALFRTHQREERLFEPPFGAEVEQSIRNGVVPQAGL